MKLNSFFTQCLAAFGEFAKCRLDQNRLPNEVRNEEPVNAERVRRALEFTRTVAGAPTTLGVFATKAPEKAAGYLAHIAEQRRVDLIGKNGKLDDGKAFYGDAFAIFTRAYLDDNQAETLMNVYGMHDGSPFVAVKQKIAAS